MLTGAAPFINDVGVWFAILIALAGSYFVVKARKGTADDNEAVKTATLMTGQITALTSKVQLAEEQAKTRDAEIAHIKETHTKEIQGLRDILNEKDKALERNAEDIKNLKEMVTQQAAVAQFRDEAFAWFGAIAEKVGATPPLFPEHVHD